MLVNRRLFWMIKNNSRLCSTENTFKHYYFDDRFTISERERILKILNSSPEELSKFKVPRGRLYNITNWKNKKGPFVNLTDVLKVEGVGVTILDKLCQSILCPNPVDGNEQRNLNRLKKNIILPNLARDEIEVLETVIGLHIESTGISWAKIQKEDNKLISWNYCDFSMLPQKILPVDTFELAVKIAQSIPQSDIYILESKHGVGSNKSPIKSTPYTQQLELTSMLIALINTSQQSVHSAEEYPNKIYYLRNRLPAKLFGALVGTERVSTEAIVLDIINEDATSSHPCSKLLVEPHLVNDYCKCSKGYKDLLEQSLLLVITFMELCVYNNPVSFAALSTFKK